MTPALPRRQIGAYAIARAAGRTLLVQRSAPGDSGAGSAGWSLPGGPVRHGEHPATTAVRAVAEQAGLVGVVTGVREVVAEVLALPDGGQLHQDLIVFEVSVPGGPDQRRSGAGPARWVDDGELAGRALAELAATAPEALGPAGAVGANGRPQRQRFAAYGLVTDPAGRVLLTRIAAGFPGAGRWHLPGGGTDFGEAPVTGLLRELYEETGQLGRVTGLVAVSHRRNPGARGPEGYPIDWHAVRVVYRVAVDDPSLPTVTEAVGGSTAAAAWFAPDGLQDLPTTEVVGLVKSAGAADSIDGVIMD